ncbi:MAG: HAD family hydrolase [Patescibacteria group bacterium]
MNANKILLLDRDGTLCRAMPRGEYLVRFDQFELLPGGTELIVAAKERGYSVAVVTNQPQIAKGLMPLEELEKIHAHMRKMLPGIDAVYYCPHQDADQCVCRKPKPGMLLRGLEELQGDPSKSLMVGDSDNDVGAGQAAGCKTIFIKDNQNAHELARVKPDYVLNQLIDVIPLL